MEKKNYPTTGSDERDDRGLVSGRQAGAERITVADRNSYGSGTTSQPSSTSGEVKEALGAAADKVKAEAGDMARRVQQVTGELAADVEESAKEMAGEAKRKAEEQVMDRKTEAANRLYGVAGALRETGERLHEREEENFAQYVEVAADQVERFSGYLQNANASDIWRDVEQVARRQPELFLAGALAAGFFVGRFLKSSGSRAAMERTGNAYLARPYYGYGQPSLRNYGQPASRYYGQTSSQYHNQPSSQPYRQSSVETQFTSEPQYGGAFHPASEPSSESEYDGEGQPHSPDQTYRPSQEE